MILSLFQNVCNNIIEKVTSLLPGSSCHQEAKIIIEGNSSISTREELSVKEENSDIIKGLTEKDCPFGLLFFAVMIKLVFNKAVKNGRGSKLGEIIYCLREYLKSSKYIQEAASGYQRKSIFFIIDMCLIIFFCDFFGKMMQQFLEDINQEIYYTLLLKLRLPRPIYPQRISEFKAILGEDLICAIMLEIKEYLYTNLALYEINDDLIEFVSLRVSLFANVSQIYNHYGFSKFLNFAFWNGLFAQLQACIPRARQQKIYSLTDLLFTYLTRLIEHGENMDDLEKDLKNSIGEGRQIITPCAQSFRDLLADLDPEELREVQKILARRVSRRSLKKGIIVSADWTLIPVRGHHEGAYKCWDHVTNKQVMAYKLHVLFNTTDGQPLAFMFEEKGQTSTQVLKAIIEETRQLLGVNRLGLVLYDKGYYEAATMKQVCLFEKLITPGKNFNAIKEAIEKLNMNYFVGSDKDNNMLYDTTVYFQDVDLTLRLVVKKIYKEQYVKTQSGSKKLINGHPIKEMVVVYHSYLTNIPKEELSASQLIDNYAKRWSIEHFFKEVKKNYGLTVLPSTDYQVVQNHVAMVLIMYIMITLFKKAVGGCFATCSLKTLNKNFFRAPLHRIKEEHPDLLPMFSEESKEAHLLDSLYLSQKLLLIENRS